MAYNKAREEKKWRLWKEAEEKQLRKLGVDESTIENGVPMKQIQEWLGHSDFSTTANVYAHLDYNSKLSSADAMVNGLSGALEVIS